MAYIAV